MDTSNFKEVFTSDEVKKLRAENEMLHYEAQRLDSLATDFAKRTEYWVGRCDSWQNDCEQLRQRVAELEKERDEEIARNRPLRNLIASLEEQKLHWNKQRDEYREAVSTMDSERSANATLTAERDALLEANRIACEDLLERHDRIAELKQQRDELLAAAEAIEINAEECLDFDECTAMLVPIDTYHKLMEAIASVKEKQNDSD